MVFGGYDSLSKFYSFGFAYSLLHCSLGCGGCGSTQSICAISCWAMTTDVEGVAQRRACLVFGSEGFQSGELSESGRLAVFFVFPRRNDESDLKGFADYCSVPADILYNDQRQNRMKYVVPSELRYTKEHEWASVVSGDSGAPLVRVGITDYAQSKLGDVVYVVLPDKRRYKKGEVLAELEAYKGVSEVYAPLSGEVVEVNSGLLTDPGLVNQDPYGKGWIAVIRPADLEGELPSLLDAQAYGVLIGEPKRGEAHIEPLHPPFRWRSPRDDGPDRGNFLGGALLRRPRAPS